MDSAITLSAATRLAGPTATAAPPPRLGLLQPDDLSAVAWVHGELRRTLESANKQLRRYLREAETARQSELGSVEPAVLRTARAQLHQGVGALELVDMQAAAQVLRSAEMLVQRMVGKPAAATPAAADAVERVTFALLDYLGRHLAGKPVTPVAMFPQYEAVMLLAGAERVHPADLWNHDATAWAAGLRRGAGPQSDYSDTPRRADDASRSEMESLVLGLMREPGRNTCLRMSRLCADLAAGSRLQPGELPLAGLWQNAAAVYEALANGLLANDGHTKRVASRLLAQLRASARGQVGLSDRLAQDLLFFCAHAKPPAAERAAPRLAAVRRAWMLEGLANSDYGQVRLGQHDPALLASAKRRVAAAKDTWAAVAGDEQHRVSMLMEQFALVGESLQKLFPAGHVLSHSLSLAAAQTAASLSAPPPALAMEVATAFLYVDAVLEDGELDQPDLPQRVRQLAERVDQVRQGGMQEPLETWMEELYRRVSDRQTMGSVVQELRSALSEVEKQIDQYFRQPSDNAPIIGVPSQLSSMRGVLSVLGMDHASLAVLHMRDDVEALLQTEVNPQQAIKTGTFNRLADNLGALGFLIDMLSVQPQLAKALFNFDASTGSLSATMGLGERVTGFDQFDDLETPPPADAGMAAQPSPAAVPAAVPAPVSSAAASLPAAPLPGIALGAAQAPVTTPAATTGALPHAVPDAPTPTPTQAPTAMTAWPWADNKLQVRLQALAVEAAQPNLSDADLLTSLDVVTQQVVAADRGDLARLLMAAQQGLRDSVDPLSSRALRAELVRAVAEATTPVPEPLPQERPVPASRPTPDGGTGLEDDAEMRSVFVDESREVLEEALQALRRVQDTGADPAGFMTTLRRAFHTLKGSARMVGLLDFGDAAWACEQLYNVRLAQSTVPDEALVQFTHEALAYLRTWTEAIAAGGASAHHPQAVIAAADSLRLQETWKHIAPVPQRPGSDAATDQSLVLPPVSALETAPAHTSARAPEPQPGAAHTLAARVSNLPTAADLELSFPLPAMPAAAVSAVPDIALPDTAPPKTALPDTGLPDTAVSMVDFELDFQDALPLARTNGGPGAEVDGLAAADTAGADAPVAGFAAGPVGAVAANGAGGGGAVAPEVAQGVAQGVVQGVVQGVTGGVTQQPPEKITPERADTDPSAGAQATTPPGEGTPSLQPASPVIEFTFRFVDDDAAVSQDHTVTALPLPSVHGEVPAADTVELGLEDLSSLMPASGFPADFPGAQVPQAETAPALAQPGAAVAASSPADGSVPPGHTVTLPPAALAVEPDQATAAEPLEAPASVTPEARDSVHPPALPGATPPPVPAEALPRPVPAAPPLLTLVPPSPLSPPPPEPVAADEEENYKRIGPLRISIPLFNIFLNEADELSRRLVNELAEWSVESHARPVPETAVKLAHGLAGSAGTVGCADLSALARALEHALMRSHAAGPGRPGEAELFNDTAEEIRRLLHQFAAGFLRDVPSALRERLAEHERLPQGPRETESGSLGLAGDGELPAPDAPLDPDETLAAPATDLTPPLVVAPLSPPATAVVPATASAPAAEPPAPAPVLAVSSPVAGVAEPLQAPPAVRAFVPTGAPKDAFDDDQDIDVRDTVDPELFPVFDEEAEELLPQLQARLRDWMHQPADHDPPAACMRALHTFKGGARLSGAMRLGEMAHRLETAIERLAAREGARAADVLPLLGRADAMVAALEALRRQALATPAPAPATEPAAPVQVSPPAAAAGPLELPGPGAAGAQPPIPAHAPETAPNLAVALAGVAGVAGAAHGAEPSASAVASPTASGATGPDWSRFARGLTSLPAGEERTAAGPVGVRVRAALLDRLLNQAGEVTIARSRIEADVKQLQSGLGELGESLDRLRGQLRDIEVQAESQISSRLEAAKAAAEAFDPLEMDRYTRLQELTRFMAESVNDVATLQRGLLRSVQSAEDQLAAQSRLTRELQEDLLRTRMVEFESASDRLYRTVRQAAKEADKQVRLDITGGAIELDRGVLDRMVGPFEHLLRNCVVHGVESQADRVAAGKPPVGEVSIAVAQSGNEVAVDIADDGAGLDLHRIRLRAIERRLLPEGAMPSEAELCQLIFKPGFSTTDVVTELAGRGVGLDVVRSEVTAMGGRIETQTAPGKGTRFKLLLPLTTAVTQVVMLRCDSLVVAVPSTLIEGVRRVPLRDVESAYARGVLDVDGESLPFFWLAALLQGGTRGTLTDGRTEAVAVVRSAAQRVAVHIHEVVGNQEVVVKNVGPQLARVPGLAGVTLLPSGAVALIYNPVALAGVYGEQVRRARLLEQSAQPAPGQGVLASPRVAPMVMVVDDSLTVRRATERLLVREGYRVVTAKDGQEALELLASERPVILLSDIEMPRMDGFDLLRQVRAHHRLHDLPVVMITSRIAQKHRDHASELGADHYLGKPYSEEELLRLVALYSAGAPRPGVGVRSA